MGLHAIKKPYSVSVETGLIRLTARHAIWLSCYLGSHAKQQGNNSAFWNKCKINLIGE